MKRRGFLAFMGGAAVAGPAVAQKAAASLADMSLPFGLDAFQSIGGGAGGYGYTDKLSMEATAIDEVARAKKMLATLTGLSPSRRSRMKMQMGVHQLDPDLASYRSLSLAAKIDMQRERELARRINDSRSMWQRIADGIVGPDGDDEYIPF